MLTPNDTQLFFAAGKGDLDQMETLRQQGATNYARASMHAGAAGQIAALRRLREWGLDDFEHAATSAARHGHYNAVKLCIEEYGAKRINHIVSAAASVNSIDIMDLCYLIGTDPNWPNPLDSWDFNYPLSLATSHCHVEAMEWCVAKGARSFDYAREYAKYSDRSEFMGKTLYRLESGLISMGIAD